LIISDLRVFLSLRDLHLQTGGYKRINLHLPINKIGEKYVSKYFCSLLPPSDLGFISLTKFGILWYFGDISKREKKGFKCKVYLVLDWKESLEMMFGGGGRSSLGGGGSTKRFTFSRRCHVALDFSNPYMCV
ncbi:hypothetical protein HID58_067690, partial [Brassica napus]